MGAWLVSFLFTIGASTWIYTKLQRYSGNNTQQSLVATAAIGVLLFFVSYIFISFIL